MRVSRFFHLPIVLAILASLVVIVDATNPNPCIQSSPCVNSTDCKVVTTGNSADDAICISGGCNSDVDCGDGRGTCNTTSHLCTCQRLWSGNFCELYQRCKSDYSCYNGGHCESTDARSDGTITYICQACHTGFYPPTCAIKSKTQVPFSDLIDNMALSIPPGFNRELDYCDQTASNGFDCAGSILLQFIARGADYSTNGKNYTFLSYDLISYAVQQSSPLDFFGGFGIRTIDMKGSGFGANFSLFSEILPNTVPTLDTFICTNDCTLKGSSVDLSGFSDLRVLEIEGEIDSFYIDPSDYPSLQTFKFYTLSSSSMIGFNIRDYLSSIQTVHIWCIDDASALSLGDDCSITSIRGGLDSWDFFGTDNGTYTSLNTFYTNGVKFNSVIPATLNSVAPSLYYFGVRAGGLVGHLPFETFTPSVVGEGVVLEYDLSRNSLTGTISAGMFIYNNELLAIDLSYNGLSGDFPACINPTNYPNLAYYVFRINDWTCDITTTDTSGYNYHSECLSSCPSEACISGQGACGIISGGCTCLTGFDNSGLCDDTNCRHPDESAAYFQWISTFYDPAAYMASINVTCELPACDTFQQNHQILADTILQNAPVTAGTIYSGHTKALDCFGISGSTRITGIVVDTTDTNVRIPTFFDKMTNLIRFQLSVPNGTDLNFDQVMPLNLFASSSSLQGVAILIPRLQDPIPSSIRHASSLGYLRLQGYQGSGISIIPSAIGGATNLFYLSLNGFVPNGETVPDEVADLVNLELLDLTVHGSSGDSLSTSGLVDENRFSGELNPLIWRLGNLKELYIQGNNFTGTIPGTFGSVLTHIVISENSLQGVIPSSILSISGLDTFYAAANNFDCPPFNYSTVLHNDYSQYVSECEDCACQNGGVCLEATNDCECPIPFFGFLCQYFPSPNPCVNNAYRHPCDGGVCVVNGTGNTLDDSGCVHRCTSDSDCRNGGYCNSEEGVCNCPSPYGGNVCEVINQSSDTYRCNNGDESHFARFANGAYVYGACSSCPVNTFGARCVQLHPSEVIIETIIDTLVMSPPYGYDRNVNVCAQKYLLGLSCDFQDPFIAHHFIMSGVTFNSTYQFLNLHKLGIPEDYSLDFSDSTHLDRFILEETNIGVTFNITFANLNLENVANLAYIGCHNGCDIRGTINLVGLYLLQYVKIHSPFSEFDICGTGEIIIGYSEMVYLSAITNLTSSTTDFALISFPNIIVLELQCVYSPDGISMNYTPDCEMTLLNPVFTEGDTPPPFFFGRGGDNYTSLVVFDAAGVNFNTVLPGTLNETAPNLIIFNCYNCQLRGEFPENFFLLGREAENFNSSVAGIIPLEITSTDVQIVLEYNNLTGSIYDILEAGSSNIHVLFLDNNHLTGQIPTYISRWGNGTIYQFANNDWDCFATFGKNLDGDSFIDTTSFDFLYACQRSNCSLMEDTKCYTNHGGCGLDTQTCFCYRGFENSDMGETNCAQDSQSVVLCDWFATLSDPTAFLSLNDITCQLPLCSQVGSITHSVNYPLRTSNCGADLAGHGSPVYTCHGGFILEINIVTGDAGAILPENLDRMHNLASFKFTWQNASGINPPEECFPSGLTDSNLSTIIINKPITACSIPDFSTMPHLFNLYINCNNAGSDNLLPFSMRNYNNSRIQYFSLVNCPIVCSDLPITMAGLPNLIYFEMSHSNITGELPSDLFTYTENVFVVVLNGNEIQGTIPSNVSSNLCFVDLSDNQLMGTIPSVFSEPGFFNDESLSTGMYFVSPQGLNDFSCGDTNYTWSGHNDGDEFNLVCDVATTTTSIPTTTTSTPTTTTSSPLTTTTAHPTTTTTAAAHTTTTSTQTTTAAAHTTTATTASATHTTTTTAAHTTTTSAHPTGTATAPPTLAPTIAPITNNTAATLGFAFGVGIPVVIVAGVMIVVAANLLYGPSAAAKVVDPSKSA